MNNFEFWLFNGWKFFAQKLQKSLLNSQISIKN